MRVLVLGGTQHVGRAVVEVALERGDEVTTVNRGTTPVAGVDVERRTADRRDPAALAAVLGRDTWDAVIDTWSQEPVVVRDAARLLRDRVGHYGYVSSRSVYAWPMPPGADESAPVVEGSAASEEASDYAAAKRGGELAAAECGAAVLLARAGLVLGPYEVVGRLPWWLRRIGEGGQVPAPGPRDRPLQYVDARDLAVWMLDAAERGTTGAFNAVSQRGHATIGSLLEACAEITGGGARLHWCTPEEVAACSIQGWTDLPIWTPPTGELAALHDADVTAAHAMGLHCRPVRETVADTWSWLMNEGYPVPTSSRAGSLGLSAAQEACLLGR